MTMMKQCVLQKDGYRDVRWVETGYAVKGKPLRIKTAGNWEDGWEVVQAFETEIPAETIQEQSRNYKNHRKATDV